MNCKNCGAVLSPNSTICSMCGAPVGNEMTTNETNLKQDVLELVPNESEVVKSSNEVPNVAPVQEPVVELPVQNETPIVEINEPMVKAPVQNIDSNVDKVPTLENTNVENNINNVEINKKKSDTLFYVVLGVLSFAIVAAVVYLLFFSNK